ncbi:RES domain-containing protein [Pseudoalteromonas sp. S1727]|uniref:HEPN-associated N-terminal domain-containing protein n=1 Tax=Pseudoalteromonas sp. S1727 TaxID=2066514 RepID=UPI001109CD07|nr:HEPN-associated N-terminal domain-containing protein [Pseudoalteromonas sp. S1727]TMN70476.1 RES domain-containing protein [Pseudoalteromonas sp. S1727]
MEEEERGFYSVGDKYVCSACVGDKDLGRFIKDNGDKSQCTYCQSNHSIVLHFDELMKFILECLSQEYGDPNNVGVAWDKGWVGEVFDTYDFLDEVGIPIENMEFQDDVLYSLSDRQWCKQDFYNLSPELALSYGWKEFVNAIKHKSRYVFYRVQDSRDFRGYEEIAPSYFLDALCNVIESLALYKKIEIGTTLTRVRIHNKGEKFTKAEELGPPPLEYATYPNRMSPSGIPMFYGAFNLKTAIAETYTPDGQSKVGTVGKFETVKRLTLVDLSKLPPFKGIFSGVSRDYRHGLSFLIDFLEDFTAPISKDGREHIDYVPTQVVSEHLRFIHKTGEGNSIDGIIYPSSKDCGKKAVVLFCENECCSDEANIHENTMLKLTKVTRVNPERYI